MSDFPDYTTLMQIIGSDIMVPIDVQGAYIMMPVDIQAQYITLDIDIVAQTVGNIAIDIAAQTAGNIDIDIAAQTIGNLAVNIAASDITLNINISTQSINLNIDIEAQSVGVYLQPEWAGLQGIDKDFEGGMDNCGDGSSTYIAYSVLSDETLYVTYLGFEIRGQASEDRGANQMGHAYVYDVTDELVLGGFGGNGGGNATYTKPIIIPPNHLVRFMVVNMSGHNCSVGVSAGGYVI